MTTKTLHLLTGPTAVGKTQLSLELAQSLDAEILSCDSTCFYIGMDIGTAKPTKEEQALVPHHGIDLVPPSKQFSIKEYIDYAVKTINDIHSRGKNVLVIGGSGFYLNAFLKPVIDTIEVPETTLTQIASTPFEEQKQQLLKLNPNGLGSLDLNNPRRVSKALARCLHTGKPYLELLEQFESLPTPFDHFNKHLTLLTRSKESLKNRIIQRVESMLDDGLIEEVERLLKQDILLNHSAASAIGYKETINHIHKSTNLGDLKQSIITNTNRLVAKQRKWFRHQIKPDRILSLD